MNPNDIIRPTSAPLADRWDAVGDRMIRSRVRGTGPSVVLVHGYGVSGRYLLPLANVLAARYTAWVPDLPGRREGRAEGGMAVGDLAEMLGDWLDVVGLSRPTVVANSMGCQVVTELAVRRPHSVGPLVLTAPTIEPARRSARHQVFRALRDSMHEPMGLVTLAVRDRARRGVTGLHAIARSALTDRIEERLPHVRQRTVVVHGEHDRFVSLKWSEEVARLIPNGRLLVVPDGSHAVPYTHPTLVAEVVEQLIATAGGPAPAHISDRRHPLDRADRRLDSVQVHGEVVHGHQR